MDSLFDKNFDVIGKSMDMYLLRHQITADNIANAETPFYKARRVDFENALQSAVDNADAGLDTSAHAIANMSPVIFEDPEAEVGQDLNTVDMDREMASMTKNDVKYSAAAEAITKKFAILRYAIQEGGGGGGG
jgi:flagellar basal-body rod protein FlgB